MRLKGKIVFFDGLPFLVFSEDDKERCIILFENDTLVTENGTFTLQCQNDSWHIGEQSVFQNDEISIVMSIESYEARNFIQPECY